MTKRIYAAIAHNGVTRSDIQSTRVKFADMSEDEVAFLAERGDPLDRAGAYAIQEQAALFIEQIEGDYWNVVGLPIRLVYELVGTACVSGRSVSL